MRKHASTNVLGKNPSKRQQKKAALRAAGFVMLQKPTLPPPEVLAKVKAKAGLTVGELRGERNRLIAKGNLLPSWGKKGQPASKLRQAAKNFILQNPTLYPSEVVPELTRRGFSVTGQQIFEFKRQLMQEGHRLPVLKLSRKPQTDLYSKRAAIMKAVYENPRVGPPEIRALLAKAGVKVSIPSVDKVRAGMKKVFGEEIDFSIKAKPVNLTAAQQASIPNFQRAITWALHHRIFPTLNWSNGVKQEFGEFARERVRSLVKHYDASRAGRPTYVLEKLRYLTHDFIRIRLKQGMGISHKESRVLIKIIREKNGASKLTHKEIADKIGSSKGEVDGLWRAFTVFKRIQGRLGRHVVE